VSWTWLIGYHRKLNESPTKVEDPAVLKLPLCLPKVKKITLHFPLGLEVVARNMKGVTIKDALDAIHKQFKKRVSVSFFPSIERNYALSMFLALTFRPHPQSSEQYADLQLQADDEFEKPYLAGFEWDPSESYTRFVVHQSAQPTSSMSGGGGGGGKKKKNKNAIPEEGGS
jgi:hypothetical protein